MLTANKILLSSYQDLKTPFLKYENQGIFISFDSFFKFLRSVKRPQGQGELK